MVIAELVNDIHPGEVLREDFVIPNDMDIQTLSDKTGLSPVLIERLLEEAEPISSDVAERLGRCFGTSPELWMSMQRCYDLSHSDMEAA